MRSLLLACFCINSLIACHSQSESKQMREEQNKLLIGAEVTEQYIELLQSKKVALVANHASVIAGTHLVDSLQSLGVQLVKIFSPEHGFRGKADAGAKVASGIDEKSGLPVISLYGDNKKPKPSQLADVDIILFDLQDVGVRFYTYLSTMHYVMEAAAEKGIKVIVLDRPNPFMNVVDGPIMQREQMSFVGLHPVPLVYGMTIGEYALMINGESWLENDLSCDLELIKCRNLKRDSIYTISIPPSPNLPNMTSILCYPSLALFEGTEISVGRGTEYPFQQIGHPQLKGKYDHQFIPEPTSGASSPKLKGEKCYGIAIQKPSEARFQLNYLLEFYQAFPEREVFFNNYFPLLAGNNQLKADIKSGLSEAEIRASWKADLTKFKKELREKYLIYD